MDYSSKRAVDRSKNMVVSSFPNLPINILPVIIKTRKRGRLRKSACKFHTLLDIVQEYVAIDGVTQILINPHARSHTRGQHFM